MRETDQELRDLTSTEAEVAILWAALASIFAVVPPPWPMQLPARPSGLQGTCGSHGSGFLSLVFLDWNAGSTQQIYTFTF